MRTNRLLARIEPESDCTQRGLPQDRRERQVVRVSNVLARHGILAMRRGPH